MAENKVEPIPLPGGALTKEVIQGATLGFGEEAMAGARSMFPGQPSYKESVEAERQQLREFESKSPLGAMAGQFAGAVIPAVATMGMSEVPAAMEVGGNLALSALKKYAPGFLEKMPEFLKSGISGVETGIKAGIGGSEGKDTTGEAIAGGFIGGATGAAGRIAIDAAAPAFRNLFGSPSAAAAKKISEALEADKTTPEDLIKKLHESSKSGAPLTLSDVGGENLRAVMRVATNVPGEARDISTRFLNDRQAEQFARINKDVEETMLGTKAADVSALKRSLDKVRKDASAPLYEQANKVKIQNTEELADLLNRMPSNVLDYGRRIYKTEGVPIPKLPGKIEDVVASTILDKDGNIIKTKIKTEPNDFRIYDLIKRGLDNAIEDQQDKVTKTFTDYGRSLIDLKQNYLQYLDKANPPYGAARELWAGPTRAQRLLDKGRQLFNSDPSALSYEMSKLTPGEKQYFRLGAAQAVKEAISGSKDMADKAGKIFSSERNRELLKPAFPTRESFDEFSRRMETENKMTRSRNFLLPTAGSKTAGLGVDVAEIGGEAERGALSALMSGGLGGAALALAPGAYGKVTGMTPQVASSLQKSLLTPGVDTKGFANQLAAARKASDLARQRQGQAAKALTVPLAMPGATEQYK